MGSQTGRQQVQEGYYGDPLSWTLLSSQDRLQTTHDTPLSSLPLLLHHHHDHSSFHASAGVCGSTQETPFGVCGIVPAQVSATAAQSLNHQHHYQNHNGNPNQVCNGEDFVGTSGMGFVQASPHSRDATELNLGVSVAGATAKRPRSGNGGGGWSSQVPTCQVDGCWIDLSCAKHYYRRHRVCEYHSKSVAVNIAGRIQRFCQQCSRFHLLHDFDECKRSCRKRLEEHNRRRRKNNHPLENSDAGLVIHGEDQVGAIDVSGNSAYLNLYSPHFKPSQIVGEESSSRSVHDIEKPQHSDDCRLWVEVNSFAESSGITQGRKQQTQDERDDGTIRFASD